MKENGCDHFTIGCKYTYAICFNDISLRPWMVCGDCLEYFKLERNVRESGIRGIWDIRKPSDTPSNLCDHVLRYYDEV